MSTKNKMKRIERKRQKAAKEREKERNARTTASAEKFLGRTESRLISDTKTKKKKKPATAKIPGIVPVSVQTAVQGLKEKAEEKIAEVEAQTAIVPVVVEPLAAVPGVEGRRKETGGKKGFLGGLVEDVGGVLQNVDIGYSDGELTIGTRNNEPEPEASAPIEPDEIIDPDDDIGETAVAWYEQPATVAMAVGGVVVTLALAGIAAVVASA